MRNSSRGGGSSRTRSPERDRRRERSRSRSPPRGSERSYRRSPERDRGYSREERRDGRDSYYDSRDRDRERGGDREKDKALTKAQLEQKRKERLEMVKRFTRGDDEDEPEKASQSKAGDGSVEVAFPVDGDDDAAMMQLLGFGGFDTTKEKQVEDNTEGAVCKNKKRVYRQYMNRRGGFNRPLQKI